MNSKEYNDQILTDCIKTYGADAQVDMCLEEMSELTKALLKYRRKMALNKNQKVNPISGNVDLTKARKDIIDELADVKIMCRQMEMIFHAEKEVEERVDFKINRQVQRLEKNN